MSLNSKTPTYVFLVNIAICLVICLVIWLTQNPLAILGVFLLQEMPVFQESISPDALREMMDEDYDDEETPERRPTAPADDYNGTKAGFTAKVVK